MSGTARLTAPVLFVGDSGEGKSTAIEHLPQDRTLVINTEDKPLPFEEYASFKVVRATTYKKLMATLQQLAEVDATIKNQDGTETIKKGAGSKYDYVVIDSFTAIAEFIERYVTHMYNGFEQWKQYNLILSEIVNKVKALPQQPFMIALPEQKDMSFGETKSYVRVKGKELKYGWVESQFAIVLYTNPIYDEESGEMTDVEMLFRPNKKNTAKAPQGLFKVRPKNDMLLIDKRIQEFYAPKERNAGATS